MKELKTLKDLAERNSKEFEKNTLIKLSNPDPNLVSSYELRQEAIKHAKEFLEQDKKMMAEMSSEEKAYIELKSEGKCVSIAKWMANWITYFFNLTDEDLKNERTNP